MTRTDRFPGRFGLALATLAVTAPWAAAQTPLSLGAMVEGDGPFEGSVTYAVDVESAGFLTVVVRSLGGEDVRIVVTDDEHQTLPDGTADFDVGGDLGAEQVVVTLPFAGAYHVIVESYDYVATGIRIGASFLASDAAASEPDPDGKPSGARSLVAGDEAEDSIESAAGDAWDWFRIVPERSGVLTVLTRAADGDLRLELFAEGAYREPLDASDQDQGGVLGNEAITVDVTSGVPVYVRVTHSFGGGPFVAYRLATGLIPG